MSRADSQRVCFEASTVDELVRKCRKFIGEAEQTVLHVSYGDTSANAWPLPSWAPKGSRWAVRHAPPALLGPDGKEIAVNWVAGTPQKPKR